MILVRLVICFVLLVAPVVLLVVASRKAENMIYLMFPVVAAVPATLGALLVFAPLEAYLSARGLAHLKNVAVPLAGALLIVVFLLVVAGASGRLGQYGGRLRTGGLNAVAPIVVWSLLGVLWGALWRVSEFVLRWVELAGRA